MNIAIVSGKGGAGKTTIATNLFEVLRTTSDLSVELIDANVEQPNAHLFVESLFNDDCITKVIQSNIPSFDTDKCTFCGRCVHFCAYNAIVMVKEVKQISVYEDICKSCGACTYACNDSAIFEVSRIIGDVSVSNEGNAKFVEGRLSIGSTLVKPIIKAVKREITKTSISIIDTPPGISSYISEIIYDANFVIVVAEPSVFGLHDLKLMIKSLNDLRKDFGVVVNRFRGEYNEIHEYLKENNIPLLMNLPFKTEYAEWNSQTKLLVNNDDSLNSDFLKLFEEVKSIYIQKSMYR